MKCLVTGGAGFIGSHIQDLLIESGHEVAVLDNLSAGKKENLNEKSTFFQADIKSPEEVEKVFSEFVPDVLFHLAAQTSVPYSMDHQKEDMETNILGSMNVFLTAAKHNVKKIIYTNTGGAYYGDVPDSALPIKEDYPVLFPTSFYGVSKYTAEQYLRLVHNVYKTPIVALRYANVYGPRQEGNHEAGIIAIFLKKMLHGESCTINGDGSHSRDYVCVLDVAKANLKAMEYECDMDYFNIATGIETSNKQVYELLAKSLGITTPVTFGPARAGDTLRNCLSIEKAKEKLGWEPEYTLEKGVQITAEFYKKHQ